MPRNVHWKKMKKPKVINIGRFAKPIPYKDIIGIALQLKFPDFLVQKKKEKH